MERRLKGWSGGSQFHSFRGRASRTVGAGGAIGPSNYGLRNIRGTVRRAVRGAVGGMIRGMVGETSERQSDGQSGGQLEEWSDEWSGRGSEG